MAAQKKQAKGTSKPKRTRSKVSNTGINSLLKNTMIAKKANTGSGSGHWVGSYKGHGQDVKALWKVITTSNKKNSFQVDAALAARILRSV